MEKDGQKQIISALIIVGIIIIGAFLLKGSNPPVETKASGIPINILAPIDNADRTLGNPKATVAVIIYEDFQCPFCGAVSGLESISDETKTLVEALKQRNPTWTPYVSKIIKEYVEPGKVLFVYRDFAFLGTESQKAAEAARCAEDQGKFWEYHDYLFSHQNGENRGYFADANLKFFAKELGLDNTSFDKCLDEDKYAQAVYDSRDEAVNAGITGTPKGFIVKNNNEYIDSIEGAESYITVKTKIDNALK